MKQVVLFVFALAFTMASVMTSAQVKTPAPSPLSTLTQKVGLSEVTVEYSRPGVKGRKIFGDLVPYGEMWRTGANGSTDFTFSDDVIVAGNKLEKGKYALYTIPNKEEWTVIFYKNADFWGTPGEKFDEADVAAKFTLKPMEMPFSVESFSIDLNNITNNGAEIMLFWDNVMLNFPMELETDAMVMKTIEKTMAGPSANDYFSAGRYYYDTDKDLETAHEWVSKATEMRDDAFWMFRLKSEIEAKLGDYKSAINTAKKSMELAEKAGNKQYVKYNKENIAKWTMK